jgi:hypothetical protein
MNKQKIKIFSLKIKTSNNTQIDHNIWTNAPTQQFHAESRQAQWTNHIYIYNLHSIYQVMFYVNVPMGI